MNRKHHNQLKNIPGEPIVNRDLGAIFYCLDCGKRYQKCRCKVYRSADTLKRDCRPIAERERAA